VSPAPRGHKPGKVRFRGNEERKKGYRRGRAPAPNYLWMGQCLWPCRVWQPAPVPGVRGDSRVNILIFCYLKIAKGTNTGAMSGMAAHVRFLLRHAGRG
jgi:hypothetical protein